MEFRLPPLLHLFRTLLMCTNITWVHSTDCISPPEVWSIRPSHAASRPELGLNCVWGGPCCLSMLLPACIPVSLLISKREVVVRVPLLFCELQPTWTRLNYANFSAIYFSLSRVPSPCTTLRLRVIDFHESVWCDRLLPQIIYICSVNLLLTRYGPLVTALIDGNGDGWESP